MESYRKPLNRDIGLCAGCAHARRIPSSRGSEFYLCEYSASDPAYPKYPRLPVVQCAAYAPAKDEEG